MGLGAKSKAGNVRVQAWTDGRAKHDQDEKGTGGASHDLDWWLSVR